MTGVRALQGLASIPVTLIDRHPDNPRRTLGDLAELADSIREVGILQPLTVERLTNGRFRIISGHRRLAAACLVAGLTDVPCIIRRDQLPDESLILMLIENMQRRNLDPIEEAHALKALLDMVGTQHEVARRIGKSQAAVSARLSLLRLTKAEQSQVRSRQLPVGDAHEIARERSERPPRNAVPYQRGWHLGKTHPLASLVARCAHTAARKVGGVGCGECWEAAIRDDERTRITGQGATA